MIITNQLLNAVVCHLFEIPIKFLIVVLAMQNNEPALLFHHSGIHSTGIEKRKQTNLTHANLLHSFSAGIQCGEVNDFCTL